MWLKDKLIASPLNYTGGKYKLLTQIIPLFPYEINTFYDLFCGGCNVGVNVYADKIICNDTDNRLMGLLQYLQRHSYDYLKKEIDSIIDMYHLSDTSKNGYEFYNCDSSAGLGNYNKKQYLQLRNDFNHLTEGSEKFYLFLYVLIIYSFNNQIRFNDKKQFNLPVGKRDFNLKMQNKLKCFVSAISKVTFTNLSFDAVSLGNYHENDFVYADPPYLITCATYNESGWNEDDEQKLLNYLDLLHNHHIKFALSNVLTSNGKQNHILHDWIEKHPDYHCHHLNYSYSNANYHRKNKDTKSDEVLITNY